MSAPTIAPASNFLNLPVEMRAIPNWIAWRSVASGKPGETTKIPYVPGTENLASVVDPAKWRTFDFAVENLSERDSGLGFCLTESAQIIGIDLDDVRDPLTGEIKIWARRIVAMLGTYAEVSPSGTGIHALAKGKLPPGARKSGCVELYSDKRYLACTGQHIEGAPKTIEAVELEWLHALMAAGTFNFAKNPKLEKLLAGDWSEYPSQSEADLALCGLLFDLGLHETQVDTVFQLSGLMREKWTESRGQESYGMRTLRAAMRGKNKPAVTMAKLPASSTRTNATELICGDSGQPKPLLENALRLLRDHAAWRGVIAFDEFSQQITLLKASPDSVNQVTFPRALADSDIIHAAAWLQRQSVHINSTRIVAEAIHSIARERAYDPVQQYLRSLKWDGVERLDHWLHICADSQDNAYTRAVARKWLISGVARIFQPGAQADHCLLLVGKQGLGKSSGLRALVPNETWYTDHLSALGTKDSRAELRGHWLVELSELSALKRAEIETVKSFITERADSYREPYGRTVTKHPRQNIFAATTNSDAALNDESGNRRFWPVVVSKVDVAAITNSRDQLWAEAVHAYQSGETWWLDNPELIQLAEQAQDSHYEAGPRDPVIESWIKTPHPAPGYESLDWNGSTRERINVTDVALHGLKIPLAQLKSTDSREIARCLRHLGYVLRQERSGSYRGTRYYYAPEREGLR